MKKQLFIITLLATICIFITSCGEDSADVDPAVTVSGCTDPLAINFDSNATIDNGSCMYEAIEIEGCLDAMATNYNSEATVDDGSCTYAGDDFIGSYLGSLDCAGLVSLISTDSLSFDVNYGVAGPGEIVTITLNNLGVTFNGTVSGNVITVDSTVPGLAVPDPPIIVDLIVTGMPTLDGNVVSGDLTVSVYIEGTIGTSDPLATEICAMSGTKQ